MNHKELIEYFARELGVKNNHIERIQYPAGDTNRNVIPDLVKDETYYEIELTGNKEKYHYIKDKHKVLIIGVSAFEAFDEVRIFAIQDPKLIEILGPE